MRSKIALVIFGCLMVAGVVYALGKLGLDKGSREEELAYLRVADAPDLDGVPQARWDFLTRLHPYYENRHAYLCTCDGRTERANV